MRISNLNELLKELIRLSTHYIKNFEKILISNLQCRVYNQWNIMISNPNFLKFYHVVKKILYCREKFILFFCFYHTIHFAIFSSISYIDYKLLSRNQIFKIFSLYCKNKIIIV